MLQVFLVEARLGAVSEGVSGSDNMSDLLGVVFCCPRAVWERHAKQRGENVGSVTLACAEGGADPFLDSGPASVLVVTGSIERPNQD